MHSWVVVVLACLPLLALSQTQAPPPWAEFCGGRECPPYTVVVTDPPSNEYEVRRYDASTWVEARQGPNESRPSFWRLFRYIKAGRIPMTVPVLKSLGNPTQTMMFYIPNTINPVPAVPSNETLVSIRTFPAKEFYVRVFKTTSKEASKLGYAPNALALRTATANLNTQGLLEFTAGFHSPWFNGQRHNEVWLEKK